MESARHHESKFVASLLDTLHARGFKPETCAMDKGYDKARVYAECEERECEPIIPLRRVSKQPVLPIGVGGDSRPASRAIRNAGVLYRGRAAVEPRRAFSRARPPPGRA